MDTQRGTLNVQIQLKFLIRQYNPFKEPYKDFYGLCFALKLFLKHLARHRFLRLHINDL